MGDPIEVKVLRVDAAERKIGLSRKRLHLGPEEEPEEEATSASQRPARELRGGTGSGGGKLFNVPTNPEEE